MAGLMPIKLGTRVKSATVNRAVVAPNTRGRAVFIDPNPRATYIAYDNAAKAAVYVDQESAIRLGLSPITYYLFLLARLNTDMKGNVVGDDFVVEYLKVSDKVYEEFMDSYNEMEVVRSVVLKLEVKKSQEQDFSFTKMVPSKDPAMDTTLEKIKTLDVEQLWAMVQANCARSEEEYLKIKEGGNQQAVGQGRQSVSAREQKAIEYTSSGSVPLGPAGGVNSEFQAPDEFEED